jgi:hypothetical protein
MLTFDMKQFERDMSNMIQYSIGFLEGVHQGRKPFMENLGASVIQSLKEFIDSNARVDPAKLQHIYEWYQSGSPNSRLFDIKYSINGNGLSIGSTFSQSMSIKDGSNVPFYDKARIMEQGIPVTITPNKSKVLAFDVDGQEVFTSNSVTVADPGGQAAKDGLKDTIDLFFGNYFTQSYLVSSGIFSNLENPIDYKNNFSAGVRGGKSVGIKTGHQWMSRGGIIV